MRLTLLTALLLLTSCQTQDSKTAEPTTPRAKAKMLRPQPGPSLERTKVGQRQHPGQQDGPDEGAEGASQDPPAKYSVPTPWTFKAFPPAGKSWVLDTFAPIGWSPEGAFAWVTWTNHSEGCGECTFFTLTVQDMISDEEQWRLDKQFPGETKPLADIWAENLPQINKTLRLYGIVPPTTFDWSGTTIQQAGDTIRFKLSTTPVADPSTGTLQAASLQAISTALGVKTIWQQNDLQARDLGLLGTFPSPYEARTAVVLYQVGLGFEGAGTSADLKLVGCDLTTRFKR